MIVQLREKLPPGLRGALFYAAYWGVVGICEPFLTVHFLRLGFTGQQIGWLAAVFPFFNFLIAPVVARMADRSNRRILFLGVTIAGYGLALIVFPLASGFFVVLLAYALVMSFRSSVVPLADSLIARMAETRALDFGSMRLWGSVFFTVTAISLGAVWQQTGFTVMFRAAGVLFSLVLLAALLLDETPGPTASARLPDRPRGAIPDAGLMFLLAGNFLFIGAIFMAGTFQTIYMTQIGGTELHVGALFGLSAMGEVPGMLLGRRFARRFGDTNTLLAAYALTALGFVGLAMSTTPAQLLAFAALRGVGFGIILVGTITIINHRSPEGMYATYQGLLNSLCWGLAPLLCGPLGGYLYQAMGPSPMFFLNAGMAAAAVLLLLPTYRLWRETPVPAVPAVEG